MNNNTVYSNDSSSVSVNEEKNLVIKPKEKRYLLAEVFEKYCEENKTSWSEDTRKEYA